jgi:hypothetical protein
MRVRVRNNSLIIIALILSGCGPIRLNELSSSNKIDEKNSAGIVSNGIIITGNHFTTNEEINNVEVEDYSWANCKSCTGKVRTCGINNTKPFGNVNSQCTFDKLFLNCSRMYYCRKNNPLYISQMFTQNYTAFFTESGDYYLGGFRARDIRQLKIAYLAKSVFTTLLVLPMAALRITSCYPWAPRSYIFKQSIDKSLATFTLNPGEIIYIGEIAIVNGDLAFVDKYDEAVTWFKKEYPHLADKPIIKRLATVGQGGRNLLAKKESKNAK